MPTKKPGSEWPSMAAEMTPKSTRLYCRVAARTEAPTAASSAIRMPGSWIFSVSSPKPSSMSPTGWL